MASAGGGVMYEDVLIAVVGESPAIVTETLWACRFRRMNDQGEPDPLIPKRIILVTTLKGHQVMRRGLRDAAGTRREALLERPNWRQEASNKNADEAATGLEKYQAAFGWLPEPEIVEIAIDGKSIFDVTSESESIAIADKLVRLVSEIALDGTTRIHASIAGGRKTMSFFMGYVMSLFGRPQDELSHVLVNDPGFEQCSNFWFPMRGEQFTHSAPRRRVGDRDAKDADVALSILPFVRLRYQFSSEELSRLSSSSFVNLVHAVREVLEPSKVVFDREQRTITIGQRTLRPGHQNYAMLELLADIAKHGNPMAAEPSRAGNGSMWVLASDFYDFGDAHTEPEQMPRTPIVEKFNEILRSVHGANDGDITHSSDLQEFLAALADLERQVASLNVRICARNENPINLRKEKRRRLNKFWNHRVSKAYDFWVSSLKDNKMLLAQINFIREGRAPARYRLGIDPEFVEIKSGGTGDFA